MERTGFLAPLLVSQVVVLYLVPYRGQTIFAYLHLLCGQIYMPRTPMHARTYGRLYCKDKIQRIQILNFACFQVQSEKKT